MNEGALELKFDGAPVIVYEFVKMFVASLFAIFVIQLEPVDCLLSLCAKCRWTLRVDKYLARFRIQIECVVGYLERVQNVLTVLFTAIHQGANETKIVPFVGQFRI